MERSNVIWMSIMSPVPSSRYVAVVPTLAPQIEAAVQANEKERRLSASVVKAMVDAGLFRLWIPRVFGGEEAQPADLAQVVEAVSRIDGATGWCLMIGGCYGAFAGYMKEEGASHIFGRDLSVVTGGAFRPSGTAVLVDGGYRVTGRWALGSGCHHCSWLVGGCQIFDGGAPLKTPEGMPKTRIMFFPAASAEIIDTWDSIGLRGTGSHDYAVKDVFVPHNYSVSFRDPPARAEPLYSLPSIGLFATVIASVSLGIARHSVDILTALAGTDMTTRARGALRQNALVQADLGRAEGLLRSARTFLYAALDDAWGAVQSGQSLSMNQRAMLWLASTHASTSATQCVDFMFGSAGAASVYVNSGLERCVRDVRAVGQHLTVTQSNFAMVGQALLGSDMRGTNMMALDYRG